MPASLLWSVVLPETSELDVLVRWMPDLVCPLAGWPDRVTWLPVMVTFELPVT